MLALIHLVMLSAPEADEEGGVGKAGRSVLTTHTILGMFTAVSFISCGMPGVGGTITDRCFASGEPHLQEAVSWLRSQLTGQKPADPGTSDPNSRAPGPALQLPWGCSVT